MKKRLNDRICILLACLLAALLGGCGGTAAGNDAKPGEDASAETRETPAAAEVGAEIGQLAP
ncbi:MAG: ABC transporter substrate-binding protein, partial [Clostridiales Family XIII bacterium]|nr:ABC transporter substrate-binding protein [Clostridiales Family XIII bacterium]